MENKDRFVRTSLTDSCRCVDFLEISELLEIATSSSIIRFDSGGQRRGKDGGVSAGLQRCACVQQHIKGASGNVVVLARTSSADRYKMSTWMIFCRILSICQAA